jgi:hypothetical protein
LIIGQAIVRVCNVITTSHVQADEVNGPFFATATVRITIQDINDHIPTFEMEVYEVNATESSLVNTTIVSLVARDRDEVCRDYGSLLYTIHGL